MGFVKRNVFPLTATVLLLITVSFFVAARILQKESLLVQEQRIQELQGLQTELEEAQDRREYEVIDQVLGTNATRMDTDEELISQILDTALTWESHAEYVDARSAMMTTYDLDENSEFMTAFLPEPPMNIDNEGTEYPLIDLLRLDSRVKKFRAEVLSVQGTEYTYLVLVDVQSSSDDRQASSYSTSIVLLTTDSDGSASDIEGYATTSQVRSSGPH